jgi:hypothetical protein
VKERIESGEVGAVLVWDVSRLFRDETMVEPALFAQACKDSRVVVLTENEDVFDFANAREGPQDRRRFLSEAQSAADYITGQIRKMNLARDKKAERGGWSGGVVPIGYTLTESSPCESSGGSERRFHASSLPCRNRKAGSCVVSLEMLRSRGCRRALALGTPKLRGNDCPSFAR